jgi:N-methylhydantoinase B
VCVVAIDSPPQVVLHRAGRGRASGLPDADPITTEVIRHGLDAAADQMRLALRRSAFSPIIYEISDFSAALYDADVRLLAQAQSLPMFLGTLSFCIQTAVEKVGGAERLEPGDVIFSTYGYDIGSHQQDATVVVPAFVADELVGYAAVKAHHMDIGAKEIYCTDTVDIFQEGAIFPSVKLYRRGVLDRDMYRTILANSRLPSALAGDLQAQIGAAHTGLAGLYRVIDRYGLGRFRASVELACDHGEAFVRSFFERLPDGRYLARGAMDNDGISEEAVPFEILVEIAGSQVTVDFTNSPPEQVGPINCPVPTVVSAARVAMMTFAAGNQSVNEGHLRPIEVLTRPGTMFHPIPPSPIYMYYWPAMQAVDVIHRALAEAIPEAIPAGNGGDLGSFLPWGTDERGEFWADGFDHLMGQGASHGRDGGAPLMHITGSGILSPPTEVIESRRPLLIEKAELAPDSAGAGRFRGGLGVDVHYRALTDFQATLPLERMRTSPWGLHGGGSARANQFLISDPDGETTEHLKVTGLFVRRGSVLKVHTGGGGGFGPPGERDPEAVRADLREGYLSEDRARADYPHAFEGNPEATD